MPSHRTFYFRINPYSSEYTGSRKRMKNLSNPGYASSGFEPPSPIGEPNSFSHLLAHAAKREPGDDGAWERGCWRTCYKESCTPCSRPRGLQWLSCPGTSQPQAPSRRARRALSSALEGRQPRSETRPPEKRRTPLNSAYDVTSGQWS